MKQLLIFGLYSILLTKVNAQRSFHSTETGIIDKAYHISLSDVYSSFDTVNKKINSMLPNLFQGAILSKLKKKHIKVYSNFVKNISIQKENSEDSIEFRLYKLVFNNKNYIMKFKYKLVYNENQKFGNIDNGVAKFEVTSFFYEKLGRKKKLLLAETSKNPDLFLLKVY